MLHIVNGDSTAGTLARSGVPGEILSWTEALMMGPAPRDVGGEDWRAVRARHLSRAYGGHLYATGRALRALEAALERADAHDEIVLWFDPDLFCQVNLLYLMNRFAHRNPPPARLSLVCAECDPASNSSARAGGFRSVGELEAAALAALFETRLPLTAHDLQEAAGAWSAYTSPDPEGLVALLRRADEKTKQPKKSRSGGARSSKTSVQARMTAAAEGERESQRAGALSHLDAALRAHLARFPSPPSGLGRIQLAILQLLRGGSRGFASLFQEFSAGHPVYGLGDFQLYLIVRALSAGPYPLVSIHIPDTAVDRRRSSVRRGPRRLRTREDGRSAAAGDAILEGRAARRFTPKTPLDSERLRRAVVTITPAGLAVRSGRVDFLVLNAPDDWLGGVHLRPGSIWRWDEGSASVVRG